MQNDDLKDEGLKQEKKALRNYARYTGIGFQMIAVIGLFTFLGYKLDEWKDTSQPIYTAVFSLTGVCVALYQVIRSLKKVKS